MGLLGNWLPDDPDKAAAVRQGLLAAGGKMMTTKGENFFGTVGQGLLAGGDGYSGALEQQQEAAKRQAEQQHYALRNQISMAELAKPGREAAVFARIPRPDPAIVRSSQARTSPVEAPPVATAASSLTPEGYEPKTIDQLPRLDQSKSSQQSGSVPLPSAIPPEQMEQYYNALADEYEREQLGDKAKEYRGYAEKQRKKYSTDPKQLQAEDGTMRNYLFAEDGTYKELPLGVKPELVEISLGDKKLFRDKNGIKSGESFQMGYSPGDLVTMRGQDKTDERAAQSNAIAAGAKVTTMSGDLRKEFDGLGEVKKYKVAAPTYAAIVDASKRNTTQSDINIVYGIAKMYDPESVVREGEYATVANSPNIPERIKGYAQYLAGGGRLTQAVKDQIVAEATGRMQTFEKPYAAARQNYESIARRSGGDPSLLFPSPHTPAVRAVKRTGTLNGRKVIEYADGGMEYAN